MSDSNSEMARSHHRRRLHRQLEFTKAYARHKPHLAKVLERNIETLLELRRQLEDARSLQDRIADQITRFSGSMLFVYLHAVWFGVWIPVNLGWLDWIGISPFDPFPFGLLTMIVSLEAIFLSTFVLVSQNRQAAVEDERADLDLQINLLSEHEITRTLALVDAIAKHLGLPEGDDAEIKELEQEVKPDLVLRELDEKKRQLGLQKKPNGKAQSKERAHSEKIHSDDHDPVKHDQGDTVGSRSQDHRETKDKKSN
jgi:uncharacterized membrane protein